MPDHADSPDYDQTFPPELELALAHTAAPLRARLAAVFALDQRLGRIVSATTEPMLGQMRLAWWRDMLGTDASDRPKGDAVLDTIGANWADEETPLIQLVDAWELFVVAEKLTAERLVTFAEGRSAPLNHIAPMETGDSSAGLAWALADAAARISDEGERAVLIETGLRLARAKNSRPRHLKGIGVLDALAIRALTRGGRPLMEGRGASLTALRAALFG
ncbi:hypothetical protein FGU71_12420 [Erythrobacter insulae]|uniref:Phytoene synthase n=1 Tax=Erythrobacter insulae TaxID=2584124 RepID=A0A547PEP3_9SPHN|nr:hypothetical protein [Erythrobacter insulae]TRD12588.1 hypothetical protein FGU71_12420 [Erythrobacter insulae]